jgi:non-lysosomal glucosylceramidase
VPARTPVEIGLSASGQKNYRGTGDWILPKGKISRSGRRDFLKAAATAAVALPSLAHPETRSAALKPGETASSEVANGLHVTSKISFPRAFSGEYLSRISFPLGGIGTGTIGLGGRGNLQDWEIFNKSQPGNGPHFAFPSIWVKTGNRAPFSAVLERCLLPPFDTTAEGLGSYGLPGLPRFHETTFLGAFPLARIEFEESTCPVKVALEAFSPFQPLNADESGLPCAVFSYQVHNPGKQEAEVVIAWSIENPLSLNDQRENKSQDTSRLTGIVMTDPSLEAADPMQGSFAFAALPTETAQAEWLAYWRKDEWFSRAEYFWFDEFSQTGRLGEESDSKSPMASVSLRQTIPAGQTKEFRFLFTWHFPNRTSAWSHWRSPKGDENVVLGNYYCTRFENAWAAAEYVAANLPDLEAKTRSFVAAVRDSTLPNSVKDAATANLATLVSNTSFRITDGSFHGFEGCGDNGGLGFGTCTHVWNYDVATQWVFPSLARSIRETSFGYAMDASGKMDFRHRLPPGKQHENSAADGQMGQIVKLYFDWRLCGDTNWLRKQWPGAKLAMEYAWRHGGWDGDEDGVMEGVQHNTYDVEFYGPNPICETWYLAALKATAVMASAMGDHEFSANCASLFQRGSAWTDANLFNGEFYVQKIRRIAESDVAPDLLPEHDEDNDAKEALANVRYQIGEGCHVDQLVGQYMASVAGLGDLLVPEHIRKTLESILRYNAKPDLHGYVSIERTYALNDEPALVLCDYSKGGRPKMTAPYWSEVWTGLEYEAAALMISHGMPDQGVQVIENIRKRHDGKRRNPYAETEYGRHYARAMASWAAVPGLSGFQYDAIDKRLTLTPPTDVRQPFQSFWSVPSGWGRVQRIPKGSGTNFSLEPVAGTIVVQEIVLSWPRPVSGPIKVNVGARAIKVTPQRQRETIILKFEEPLVVSAESPLRFVTV